MSPTEKKSFLAYWKQDVPASIVVFLVALPLCLGIALASGAPLFSGIIAGIVGGIVVALLSGSPLGVSGPAAGLAVIVLNSIHELGAFEIFLMAVVLASVIQLILGFLKAGVIGYYFPSSVIKGMLSGIGIIIILKQVPYALGVAGKGKALEEAGLTFLERMSEMFGAINMGTVIITLSALLIMISWEQPFMKKLSFTKIVKGPLVAVLSGIAMYIIFQNIPGLALESKQLVSIPVPDSFSGFLGQFATPDFSAIGKKAVWIVAGTIAVVASLETLLCVEATDKLDPEKRVTPTNRELTAQGIGNIISGLIGGLPVTQVIVRSSANIQSGGKTKASAFIHGILLLVTAASIPSLLNLIPLASLAAILFIVGWKLAKPALFKQMYKMGMTQFIPFIVTIIGIVFTDLLIGIGLGLAVAIIQILWNNYKIPYHFSLNEYEEGKPVVIELSEDVSFLNKASIQRTLELMPEGAMVVVDSSKARTVHPDILEIFENFQAHADAKNIKLEVSGLPAKSDNYNPVGNFEAAVPGIISGHKKKLTPTFAQAE